MKFSEIPVETHFTVNGIGYRKENNLGKSKMFYNAVIWEGRYVNPNKSHLRTWVRFDHDVEIPFPDTHFMRCLVAIEDVLFSGSDKFMVTDIQVGSPPECRILYEVRQIIDGEGGESLGEPSFLSSEEMGLNFGIAIPKKVDRYDEYEYLLPSLGE